MKKIRIGVLGYASIAQKAIIPAIQGLSDYYEFVGIATRTIEKAEEINSKFQGKAFSSYSQIITKNRIDALYIPLPNALHYKWVKFGLENGIHILVEKSMACNFDEVVELNELAKTNNLALVENFQFRFHKQLHFILNEIQKGTMGEIRSIRSSFGFPAFSDSNNIRYQKKLGGGALLDAGAYPIKLAQLLLGYDVQIVSAVSVIPPGNEVDIWGGGMIKQKEGDGFLQMSFGFNNFYQCNLEIWGSIGKLSTNRIFTAPPGYSPEIIIETAQGIEKIALEPDNHYQRMLEYFYNCTQNQQLRAEEYQQNIHQSRLLEEFKKISNEK